MARCSLPARRCGARRAMWMARLRSCARRLLLAWATSIPATFTVRMWLIRLSRRRFNLIRVAVRSGTRGLDGSGAERYSDAGCAGVAAAAFAEYPVDPGHVLGWASS